MGQDRESLRDLDGVRVSVDALSPTASANGLSAERLQQAVEARLRQAGITVLTTGDFPVGDPFLRVRVNASANAHGTTAFTVDVDFVQIVFMRRNPMVTFNRAQTWKADGDLGLVEPGGLAAAVAESLGRQVDQFVREYRLVNVK